MTALCAMAVTLYLGGWQAPCAFLQFVPSYVWFALKLAAMLALFIWIRGTLPRLRIDQLMRLAWKFLVPLALLNLGVAAFWHLSAPWGSPPAQLARWVVALLRVLGPAGIIVRRLTARVRPRTYHYAPS